MQAGGVAFSATPFFFLDNVLAACLTMIHDFFGLQCMRRNVAVLVDLLCFLSLQIVNSLALEIM